MSFSAILGASSAIRAGVVTSSTRPSAPYEGQLLYETDTDRLVAYNGSSWIYETAPEGPPGLVFITKSSPSAASTVTIDNCFSSTYKHYLITYVFNGGTSNDLYLQFRYGSTTQAAGYYSAFNVASYVGSSGVNGTNNGSLIVLNTNMDVIGGQIIVSNVGTTAEKAVFTAQSFNRSVAESFNGGGYVDSAQTYTGFIFSNQGAGNVFTGTVSVYGMASS